MTNSTYTYESGRDGLLELNDEDKLRPVSSTNTAVNSFLSSKHGCGLNTLGQRTSHAETLERQGNATNAWWGYDRRVDRTFTCDAKGQVVGAGFCGSAALAWGAVKLTKVTTRMAMGTGSMKGGWVALPGVTVSAGHRSF